jgi:hypothetical protein
MESSVPNNDEKRDDSETDKPADDWKQPDVIVKGENPP